MGRKAGEYQDLQSRNQGCVYLGQTAVGLESE